jgi:hypothetical protein
MKMRCRQIQQTAMIVHSQLQECRKLSVAGARRDVHCKLVTYYIFEGFNHRSVHGAKVRNTRHTPVPSIDRLQLPSAFLQESLGLQKLGCKTGVTVHQGVGLPAAWTFIVLCPIFLCGVVLALYALQILLDNGLVGLFLQDHWLWADHCQLGLLAVHQMVAVFLSRGSRRWSPGCNRATGLLVVCAMPLLLGPRLVYPVSGLLNSLK